jgi:glycosyltransferase involved in cell wall biosynthesis
LKAGAQLLPSAVVIANSAATAKAARRYGFRHVVVVPLATDIRGTLPTAPPNGNLLFTGRLTPRKGCAWFIRNVLPFLPGEMTLRVAGTVWDEDERIALDNPRITFLGQVRGDALIHEYASALCVVVPTRDFEGFGLTAVEAAASGGLVLASRHSGLLESVFDGVTGFQLPSDDAGAWAQKIREIGDWSGKRRATFIANAIAMTQQYFTWQRVAQETLIAYSQQPLAFPLPLADGTSDDLQAQ